MVRLLKFLGFWSLLIFAGLVAVALSTFAATFLRSEGLVTGVLAVGLACVFPVSLAVASSHFYPGPARPEDCHSLPSLWWPAPHPRPEPPSGIVA